jgi:eukaryotic-like serine/threonine-protein kinase
VIGEGPEHDEVTLVGDGVSSTKPARAGEALALSQGTIIGRYVVLSRIGAGGMGVVYAAYDPELDRKIALKLLLSGLEGAKRDRWRGRLLREAQALAKLQHPNVVTIHDVGTHEGHVWLAMELIEGETLDVWLASARHGWSEVLDVVVRAGAGVAAAHAADLLHRDLKPENVMIARDGRVCVMDFGLARPRWGSSPASSDGDGDLAALSLRITREGALVGTPGYMAPEQLASAELGPAADQFSYCVMLWEALFRQRPFAGETLPVLTARVLAGKLRAPPPGSGVPRWLRRVIERGLSVEPQRRWENMGALLDALERGTDRARKRRRLATLGALGLVGIAAAGAYQLDRRQRSLACEEAGRAIEEVWNDHARTVLATALVGTGSSHAEETAIKVMPWLDAHARAWQTARTEVCMDAEVHGTWDADLVERASWCLQDRRMQLASLVEQLSSGEARSVDAAVPAAARLGDVARCRDVESSRRWPIPPAAHRDAVFEVRAEITRARALWDTGAYEDALEAVEAVTERAREIDWPPLVAEALYHTGYLLDATGRYERAAEILEAAYFEAVTAGLHEIASSAASHLITTVGYQLARPDEAFRWARHAEAMAFSLPDPANTLQATRWNNLAVVRASTGDPEGAKSLFERVLSTREAALGPDHPLVADQLSNLAVINRSLGLHDEAHKQHERALEIREKALGVDHPTISITLNNLAVLHHTKGDHASARIAAERAIEITQRTLGPDHPNLAALFVGLAHPLKAMHEYDAARAAYERALAIQEQALGPDHPRSSHALFGLAEVALARGAADEALGLAQRVLRLREDASASEAANARFLLARATWAASEDRPRALALAEQALEGYRQVEDAGSIARVEAWLRDPGSE